MALRLLTGFEIAKFSDLNFDGMSVEIRYLGVPVAQLVQDDVLSQRIVVPSRFSPEGESFNFPVSDFLEAIEEARRFLTSLG